MSNGIARTTSELVSEASEDFVRRVAGNWSSEDQQRLERRLLEDREYAEAYGRVIDSWDAVERGATSSELMKYREQAIVRARRSGQGWWGKLRPRRALIAAAASVATIGVITALLLSQWLEFNVQPVLYQTGIGEQRVIELEDRSRIALDAATKLSVRVSDDTRFIQLVDGQAQFSVAKDRARPFKVQVGDHAVVALGTVFTVAYIDGEINVAMQEGRVAVSDAVSDREPIEVANGQGLRIETDGHTTFATPQDVASAAAWRQGRVIFRAEKLSQAVRRMNRYSKLQLQIEDSELGNLPVSGVFDIGDSAEFAATLQTYLPVVIDDSGRDLIRITTLSRAD